MKRHKINENKIHVVRNAPLIENIYLDNIENTNNNHIKILYLGTINKQDGVEYLVKSLNYLLNNYKFKNFSCDIIGGGDGVEVAEVLTNELKMERYICFKGVVNDRDKVRKYLNEADICVEPAPDSEINRNSTFIKIMEYMAAKKPIVAYDLKETKYSAQNSAIYVTPGDIDGFARAMKELIENPELREELGRNGFKRIENEINWHNSEKNLLNVYYILLNSL
jgi:glycosyltransferase involved in cell wall biosynthesis